LDRISRLNLFFRPCKEEDFEEYPFIVSRYAVIAKRENEVWIVDRTTLIRVCGDKREESPCDIMVILY
jgi:hypothetical protein